MTTPLAEPAPRPQDWTVVRLGDVATFAKGAGLSKSALTPAGRHGCILYGELFTQYGAVIDAPRNRTNVSPSVTSEAGDVLMPTSDVTPRGLAKASALRNAGVALGGDILVIRPDLARVHPEFLAYAIRYDAAQVLSFVRGSTVFHLYAGDMRNFILALPPLDEQKAIATALEDCDQLIESLDELIRKKRDLELGVRTALATGRQRLPVTAGEWRTVSLEDIADVTMGQSPPSSAYNYDRRGLPLVQGKADMVGRSTVDRMWTSVITNSCQGGDIVMTVRAPVGFVAKASSDLCLGRGVCSIRSPQWGRFLYHALVASESRWERLSQGSTFTAATASEVKAFEVRVPDTVSEANRIADVLDDVEAEIDALVAQRDKTAQLKQAMMQELLTGRTRLS